MTQKLIKKKLKTKNKNAEHITIFESLNVTLKINPNETFCVLKLKKTGDKFKINSIFELNQILKELEDLGAIHILDLIGASASIRENDFKVPYITQDLIKEIESRSDSFKGIFNSEENIGKIEDCFWEVIAEHKEFKNIIKKIDLNKWN